MYPYKKNKKQNRTKRKKQKHVHFAKKLAHYHTFRRRTAIQIPKTSKCAEPPKEIKKALVTNVL
jgi:hypothetical protein